MVPPPPPNYSEGDHFEKHFAHLQKQQNILIGIFKSVFLFEVWAVIYKVCISIKALCWMYSCPLLLFVEVNNRLLNSVVTWQIQAWEVHSSVKPGFIRVNRFDCNTCNYKTGHLYPRRMTITPLTPSFTKFQPTKPAGHLDLLLRIASNVWTIVISSKFKVEQETSFYHIILPSVLILQL